MSYIQTLSGKHFNYLDIQQDDIVIEDIATALSHICRFAGHLPEFYSVGQHSVLTSHLVPQEFALEALLHDAAEAYLQDIPSPLKRLLPDYQVIEARVDAAIRQKFGLPTEQHPTVKYADLVMLPANAAILRLTKVPCGHASMALSRRTYSSSIQFVQASHTACS